jgi:hypothetical protein
MTANPTRRTTSRLFNDGIPSSQEIPSARQLVREKRRNTQKG